MGGESSGPSASASTSRAPSAPPQPQTLKVTDYLVGPQLDDALAAEQDIIVSWPFAEGQITDFMQAEALWYVCPLSLSRRAPPPSRTRSSFPPPFFLSFKLSYAHYYHPYCHVMPQRRGS